ncbi:T-box transcription factor TBX22-like [Argiope bruennichi]|uniref:T-box transcription factor TBX22-like n=1 Tax=Argiope bruennichi TaxID=94029 RepID=UPI0024944DF0|nr:T-box transcription factor TBX22-like [Argiope bruennichi]
MNQDENSTVLSERAVAFSVEALLGLKDETSVQSSSGFLESNKQNEMKKKVKGNKIEMELVGSELWSQFHELQNEMIITKSGRRIFPTLKVLVSGLDPESDYIMWIDIVPVDQLRYRYLYHSSRWIVAGSGDSSHPNSTYIHPDSPSSGKYWMSHAVTFDKLKLTNAKEPKSKGQISLLSMHKYQPRIHIQKMTEGNTDPYPKISLSDSLTFTFPETQFFTVTAYQNQQITYLKIACNPFAKGFREVTSSQRKLGPSFLNNQNILDSIQSQNEAEYTNCQKRKYISGNNALNSDMNALTNKKLHSFSSVYSSYLEQAFGTYGWTEGYSKACPEKDFFNVPYIVCTDSRNVYQELGTDSYFKNLYMVPWKEKSSWLRPSLSFWADSIVNQYRSSVEMPITNKNFLPLSVDIVRNVSAQNNHQN